MDFGGEVLDGTLEVSDGLKCNQMKDELSRMYNERTTRQPRDHSEPALRLV